MKKLLALLTAFAMVGLMACGNSSEPAAEEAGEQMDAETTEMVDQASEMVEEAAPADSAAATTEAAAEGAETHSTDDGHGH